MILEAIATTLFFPPERYDHPYEGQLIVQYVTDETIRSHCPAYGIACVVPGSDFELCVVYFNTKYMLQFDSIMRHEIGHCNGWSSQHER